MFPGWDSGLLHPRRAAASDYAVHCPYLHHAAAVHSADPGRDDGGPAVRICQIRPGQRPATVGGCWYLHAFKNTLLPVITVGGVQLGIHGGVYHPHGNGVPVGGYGLHVHRVGRSRADTSLMVGYIVFVGFIFVVVNTIVDIIYGLVNPTVRVTAEALDEKVRWQQFKAFSFTALSAGSGGHTVSFAVSSWFWWSAPVSGRRCSHRTIPTIPPPSRSWMQSCRRPGPIEGT
jgi:hypothetical protein